MRLTQLIRSIKIDNQKIKEEVVRGKELISQNRSQLEEFNKKINGDFELVKASKTLQSEFYQIVKDYEQSRWIYLKANKMAKKLEKKISQYGLATIIHKTMKD